MNWLVISASLAELDSTDNPQLNSTAGLGSSL
jgi:hypothetical protein